MKRLLLAFVLFALTACTESTYGTERVQVAPNTVTCLRGLGEQCQVIRVVTDGQPSKSWVIADPKAIKNFDYQPGYLYDLSLQSECTHSFGFGAVSDSMPTYTLIQVNSKTASSETIEPARVPWPGFC